MSKRHCVACFSQTGNTAKVAETIHRAFAEAGWRSQVAKVRFDDPEVTAQADVVGIGSPVFYWAASTPIMEWIARLPEGGGRPAYVFTTYGHVYPSNALHEMASQLAGRGYRLIGGIVVPARHNLVALSGEYKAFGAGKPNASMLGEVTDFAKRMIERIDGGAGDSPALNDFILGRRVHNYIRRLIPLRMMIDGMPNMSYDRDACNGCGTCQENCPRGAIRMMDGKAVRDSERCIKCAECLRNCPSGALSLDHKKLLKLLRVVKKTAMTPVHRVLVVD